MTESSLYRYSSSQSFFLEFFYFVLKMYSYFSLCFTSEELERKSSAVLFSPTKTKFDLLYFRSTCKKAHKRVFKT